MSALARDIFLCLFVCWLAAAPPPAWAQEFYRDRSITFVIGASPGGGYDTYSRLIAKHLGQHLAGRPTIVPQNMAGAGGLRATNYLYFVAPKDGTVIGMVDEAVYLNQILGTQEQRADAAEPGWMARIFARLLRTQEQKTDATKFMWIGRVLANNAVLFARGDAAVRRIEDAFDKELIVSASGTASRLNWTVLKNLLGAKFKIVAGYQGSNESLLAILRGEADALSMPWSVLRVSGEELMRDNKINLLLQTGAEKEADLAHVPRMVDLARDDEERRLLELFSSPSLIGRAVLAPPGTPRERVGELRRAFMASVQDPVFIADLNRARLQLSPLSGEELQAAIARMGDLPEPLIARARRVSEAAAP